MQRLALLIGIIFVISIGCFMLVHILPGDPTETILGTSDTPHNREVLLGLLGLNRGIFDQYWIWLGNLFHGNLGISFQSNQPVTSLLSSSYRIDLELIVFSQVISYIIAVPLSVYAARRPGRILDNTTTITTFAFFCLPAFVLITLLVQLLCVDHHILPGPGTQAFVSGEPFWSELGNNLKVMILPSMVLAVGSIALYFRLLRGEMVATLHEEFITVARSKGLSTNRVLWRHALRPSAITLLTSTGNNIALLVTGLFIVEYKLVLPGVGYQLVQALFNNDYLVVQGIALVTAVTVVLVNFAIDIFTTFVDPRIIRA